LKIFFVLSGYPPSSHFKQQIFFPWAPVGITRLSPPLRRPCDIGIGFCPGFFFKDFLPACSSDNLRSRPEFTERMYPAAPFTPSWTRFFRILRIVSVFPSAGSCFFLGHRVLLFELGVGCFCPSMNEFFCVATPEGLVCVLCPGLQDGTAVRSTLSPPGAP